MIAEERMNELKELFWSETNDEETQLWRDNLNEEEERLVSDWDLNVNSGVEELCKRIMDTMAANNRKA